jgi:hypothetical protein
MLLYYFFRLTKLERDVRKLWSGKQNQTQLHDVFVIQPKLVERHYYKAQRHSNAKCNMPLSEASLRTNQSFVCVKTECLCYCAHVCLQPNTSGATTGHFELCTFVQNICTSAKWVTQSNQCCLLHSSNITKFEPKSAFCVASIFEFIEIWKEDAFLNYVYI